MKYLSKSANDNSINDERVQNALGKKHKLFNLLYIIAFNLLSIYIFQYVILFEFLKFFKYLYI